MANKTLARKECEYCNSVGKIYNYQTMQLCKACLCEVVGDDGNCLYKELWEQEKEEGYIDN